MFLSRTITPQLILAPLLSTPFVRQIEFGKPPLLCTQPDRKPQPNGHKNDKRQLAWRFVACAQGNKIKSLFNCFFLSLAAALLNSFLSSRSVTLICHKIAKTCRQLFGESFFVVCSTCKQSQSLFAVIWRCVGVTHATAARSELITLTGVSG